VITETQFQMGEDFLSGKKLDELHHMIGQFRSKPSMKIQPEIPKIIEDEDMLLIPKY